MSECLFPFATGLNLCMCLACVFLHHTGSSRFPWGKGRQRRSRGKGQRRSPCKCFIFSLTIRLIYDFFHTPY